MSAQDSPPIEGYVRSSIFAQPNPLLFNIVMPGTQLPQVPPGIRNARTFLAVGKYLHYLLVQEVLHGSDPFLLQWQNKPNDFAKKFQSQFTAYAQGAYPFTTPLAFGENPLEWWKALLDTENGGIVAVRQSILGVAV